MTRPFSPNGVKLLLAGMTPDEQAQTQHLLQYLHEKATSPSGHMAEGSVSALLNRQSPAVRNAFARFNEAMETPRIRPFDEKWSEADYAEAAGLDPATSTQIKAAIDTSEVLNRTIDRLGGSDATRPDEPLSTRDVISAAIDFHGAEQNGL